MAVGIRNTIYCVKYILPVFNILATLYLQRQLHEMDIVVIVLSLLTLTHSGS